MDSTTAALFQSITQGPVLVGDLPEAPVFPHRRLKIPETAKCLEVHQKLGHLYEDALAALFEASSEFDLVRRNFQIQPDRQTTLGELDFVVRDRRSDEFIHLELAAKFYLAVETGDGLRLPGPDPIDNYYNKIRRLRTHQLVLPRIHSSSLPLELGKVNLVTQQLIYGVLFDSVHSCDRAAPEFLNPACRRGQWLRLAEARDFFGDSATLEVVPKHLWATPFELLEGSALKSWMLPDALTRCVMLRTSGSPDPFFVVPDHFPESGPQSARVGEAR